MKKYQLKSLIKEVIKETSAVNFQNFQNDEIFRVGDEYANMLDTHDNFFDTKEEAQKYLNTTIKMFPTRHYFIYKITTTRV